MFKFLIPLITLGICLAAPQRQGTRPPTLIEADIYFTISATNLHGDGNDPDGKVDPFVKVYLSTEASTNFTDDQALERIGTSETIEDDNNPIWNTVFKVKYVQGTNQVIHLIVRDYDPLNADDSLGYAAISMDDFVARGAYITHLSSSKASGITVTQTTPIYLDFTLRGIPYQDNFNGASDLYVKCYCTDIEGHNFLFHTTNMVINAEAATFTYIPFLNYRRGTSQILHFEVFDYDTWTPDDLLGSVDLHVDPFITSKRSAILSLGGTATLTVMLSRDL